MYIEWGKRIDDFKTSRLMKTMQSSTLIDSQSFMLFAK